jgi:hypothetical protein
MTSFDPRTLTDDDRRALLRWRLALGAEAEKVDGGLRLSGLSDGAEAGAGCPGSRLADLDRALGFVYGERTGGIGGSRPYIPTWLANLREFFSQDVVALVQKDAIERRGLTELLFEPETLPYLEKNVDLVATLVSAQGLIPDAAKAIARQIVREVVDELRKKLESQVRTAVLGALRRDLDSPLKLLRNTDWKRTIRRNLKGWDRERQRLIPDRFYFWANQRRRHEWDVAILVDQSGSMAESVVYSSVMAAIFASLDVLRTRLLFFDTEIVDMTPMLSDPVEVLFTAQLGGGTDINRAVAYAQTHFIERPTRTLFILLALSDSGRPSYDHGLARTLGELGVPCFGCTPKLLVQVVERIMKNQELDSLIAGGAK